MKAATYRVIKEQRTVSTMQDLEDDNLESSSDFKSMRHILVGNPRWEMGEGEHEDTTENGYKYQFKYKRQSAEDPGSGFTKHELKRMEKVCRLFECCLNAHALSARLRVLRANRPLSLPEG